MHVLPLPFRLALVLYRRPETPPPRSGERLLRMPLRPNHREHVLGDIGTAACRRPMA
jgi:hypothetical protein